MIPYLEILRPHNCLMAAVAVVVGAAIASQEPLAPLIALAGLIVFLICGAGNAINDYFDFEIDRINNPSRPLPSGMMPLSFAHVYSLALFALGTALSVFINPLALLLAAFNSLLLYLYAMKIKKRGGIGKNFTVSYLVASPFLFGGIAVGEPLVTLLLVLLAGLANTSREIIKDIQDYGGDKAFIATLPSKIGIENAAKLASLVLFLTIATSPLPYFLGILNFNYILVLVPANALFLWVSITFLRNPMGNAKSTQRLIKIGMALGLAAFLAGNF